MEAITNLAELLLFHLSNLYSTEELIEAAMPKIIEKAKHASLQNALQHHHQLSGEQKQRLEKIMQLLRERSIQVPAGDSIKEKVEFVSKGTVGLLDEVNLLLNTELAESVVDSAIIACVQKIEHYEICSYGTALAFTRQLHLHKAEQLLHQTLQEEYDADDLLTSLAEAAFNKHAVPKGFETSGERDSADSAGNNKDDNTEGHTEVVISERNINSPGGRAGTSHRRYGTGESRGH